MKIAIVKITGTSPLSQSRHYTDEIPKLPRESGEDYENRTWASRAHVKNGCIEMPGSAFANAVKTAAKRLKLQVPGKGRSEFGKHFEAGVMVPDPLTLCLLEEMQKDTLFVPSDGRPGGGKRVTKHFPRIDEWGGDVKFYIFDDIITESVFTQVVRAAGLLVGLPAALAFNLVIDRFIEGLTGGSDR